MGSTVVGSRLDSKKADELLAALRPVLHEGEEVTLLVRNEQLRPFADSLAVTNMRLIAFEGIAVERSGPRIEVLISDILAVDVEHDRKVMVGKQDGSQVRIALVRKQDAPLVRQAVRSIVQATPAIPPDSANEQQGGSEPRSVTMNPELGQLTPLEYHQVATLQSILNAQLATARNTNTIRLLMWWFWLWLPLIAGTLFLVVLALAGDE